MLADVGVVDTGRALIHAAEYGNEAPAKYLVKQFGGGGHEWEGLRGCARREGPNTR